MQKIKDAASEFLTNQRVAVTGVSRHAKDHGGNVVYKRLRDRGYEVYAVNPPGRACRPGRCPVGGRRHVRAWPDRART